MITIDNKLLCDSDWHQITEQSQWLQLNDEQTSKEMKRIEEALFGPIKSASQ